MRRISESEPELGAFLAVLASLQADFVLVASLQADFVLVATLQADFVLELVLALCMSLGHCAGK